MKNIIARYAWLIAIIIGMGLCIYSIKVIPNKIKEERTYIETTAIVVDYEECTFDDDTTGKRYIAEYKVDRNKYRITSSSCGTITKSLNSEVKVKYDPNNPGKAVFINDMGSYIIPLVGVIFIICGIILKRKQQR